MVPLGDVDGAMSRLWIARDAINWRTRWVMCEYGLLIVIYLNGLHLSVITCPMQAGDRIHSFSLKLKGFAKYPNVERLAITNVHDGVIVVEGLVQGPRKTLIWVAAVVRIASFHPYYRHAATNTPQQTPLDFNIPAWPLISKPLAPYGRHGLGDAYLDQRTND
jgi:hypothetical protein